MNDNETIALFMGFGFTEKGPIPPEGIPIYQQGNFSELMFDISWDWLMPALIKIEQLPNVHVRVKSNYGADYKCSIYHKPTGHMIVEENMVRFDAVYKAIVRFIEWYNDYTTKYGKL